MFKIIANILAVLFVGILATIAVFREPTHTANDRENRQTYTQRSNPVPQSDWKYAHRLVRFTDEYVGIAYVILMMVDFSSSVFHVKKVEFGCMLPLGASGLFCTLS